ncbi:MAG: hypothetical protein ABIA63_00325, partial [bacterium]
MKLFKILMIILSAVVIMAGLVFFIAYKNRSKLVKKFVMPIIQKELGFPVKVKDLTGNWLQEVEVDGLEIGNVIKASKASVSYNLGELKNKKVKKITINSLRLFDLDKQDIMFSDFKGVPEKWSGKNKKMNVDTKLLLKNQPKAQISGKVEVGNKKEMKFSNMDIKTEKGNFDISGFSNGDSTDFSEITYAIPGSMGTG